MACSTGQPWRQAAIHWRQWQRTFYPFQVCKIYTATMHIIYILYIATSTDVEHAFSQGGLTVSKMRHKLSDESTRAASVLGSWCDLPGAIPHNEIMAVFQDKGKWTKDNNMFNLPSDVPDVVML
jgi:hypothetical protein